MSNLPKTIRVGLIDYEGAQKAALYGLALWVFAIGGITAIAGLPFFLNFTGITWVALVGHVLYGIVLVAVMRLMQRA